jgi:hypothetical protein
MVGMCIDGLDVMQRAGFRAERRRKFSLQIPHFGQVFKLPADRDLTAIPSKPSQLILPHPMHDFGWLVCVLMGLM